MALTVLLGCFDLNLCISNGTVSTKLYEKRDDFDIVNFLCLDGGVPRRDPYIRYTYLSLLDFTRASSNLSDFTTVIKPLLLNFLGRAIIILNFVKRFRNITVYIYVYIPQPRHALLLSP